METRTVNPDRNMIMSGSGSRSPMLLLLLTADSLEGQMGLLLKDQLPTRTRTTPKAKIVLVSEAALGGLLYRLFQVVPGSTCWFVPCVFICYLFLLIKHKRIKKKNKGARSWKRA